MTITYTSEVATATRLGVFWKLLFRWRGSIYKLIWPEMIIFVVLYYALRFIYNFALTPPQRQVFEDVSLYCQNFTTMIPLTFVLGFYVNIVMTRWWDQYNTIPWPDSLAVFVSTSISGLDERGRLTRRTVMRYVNLSLAMTLAMVSPKIKKRFPTHEHFVQAGIMTKSEKMIFENLDELYSYPKYWMPLVWAGTIVSQSRKEGRIRDDFAVKTILDTINAFRAGCGGLLNYDWISIPLVYTQVVTLAVYTFFVGNLMGRQFLDPSKGYANNTVDLYVPWFTILQFLFYMGWLKVAETLINPFGEDDDDFELNWLVDRNIQLSYLIVDGMHSEHPEMVQDKYWDEGIPQELPYTVASEPFRTLAPLGSTACMEIPQDQQYFLKMNNIADGDSQDEINRNSQFHSIIKENCSESDLESVLWITPQSIPRNQSILSLFKNKMNPTQHQHTKLTYQLSEPSSIGNLIEKKPEVTRKQSGSTHENKSFNQRVESKMFHTSLESLNEEPETTPPKEL